MIYISDEDRHALGGDAPGKPQADRDPDSLLDLFLDSLRGTGDQVVGFVVE